MKERSRHPEFDSGSACMEARQIPGQARHDVFLNSWRSISTQLNYLLTRVKDVKNIEYVLLLVILVGAFAVRLYKIDVPLADWHSWRQSDTASVSRIYIDQGIDILTPKYYDISAIQTGLPNPEGYRFVEFPFFNIFHAILAKNIPLSGFANPFEVWGRFISIICALITCVFLFLLGKRVIGAIGGIWAAGFYAFLPYNIFFTRVILPEPMTAMTATIALYYFVKFADTEKRSHLFISATFFACAILLKPYIAFYGVPMLYLAIEKYGFKNLFKNKLLLSAAAIVIIPFLLWRYRLQMHPEGIPFYKWAFNGDKIRFKPAFWNWIFGERFGRLILGVWGLIPAVMGILVPLDSLSESRHAGLDPVSASNSGAGKRQVAGQARNDDRYKWFIQYCLLGVFLYVSIVATANVRHDYYQAITVPLVCLALASGSLFLWEAKMFNKWISRGILILSIGVMLIVSSLQVREYYKIDHPEIIEAGIAADALLPKDALVIAPYNGDTAFLYQTKRRGWPFVELPIPELIAKGAHYWVSVNFGDPQTQEVMNEYTVIQQTPSYVIVDLTKERHSGPRSGI
jgi:hypothetical protein